MTSFDLGPSYNPVSHILGSIFREKSPAAGNSVNAHALGDRAVHKGASTGIYDAANDTTTIGNATTDNDAKDNAASDTAVETNIQNVLV